MSYQVLSNSGFNDFISGQYDGSGPIATAIEAHFAGFSSISVNTTLDLTANVNILTPDVNGEIAVATTDPEALELVVDHGPFPATEDFDVSGTESIGVVLTAPSVDFSLTASDGDFVFAGIEKGENVVAASIGLGNGVYV